MYCRKAISYDGFVKVIRSWEPVLISAAIVLSIVSFR